MADLIDRQKIKARFEPWLKVKGYSEGELNIIRAVLYEITIMPSAQPERYWIDSEGKISALPSAQPDVPDTNVGDMISRQAAIDAFYIQADDDGWWTGTVQDMEELLKGLPSAQPTLYGYRIEHLAYIARVMEKEGVTAEYAVRTFNDMGRAIKMIADEAREIAERSIFNGFNQQTGSD